MTFQIENRRNNQNGFTLIEMLLVLVIMMLICTIGISVGKKQMDRQLETRFIEQLKADIELTQALSFQYQGPASLYIFDHINEIHIYSPKFHKLNPILIRKYPKNIEFRFYSTLDHVIFTENQTVTKSGTIIFSVNGRRVELIVYLGEGRVKIVQ